MCHAHSIVLFTMFITAISGIAEGAIAGGKRIYTSGEPATANHMINQIPSHKSVQQKAYPAEWDLSPSADEDRYSLRGKKYGRTRQTFVDKLTEAPDRSAPAILSEFGVPNIDGVPPVVLLFPPKQETIENMGF